MNLWSHLILGMKQLEQNRQCIFWNEACGFESVIVFLAGDTLYPNCLYRHCGILGIWTSFCFSCWWHEIFELNRLEPYFLIVSSCHLTSLFGNGTASTKNQIYDEYLIQTCLRCYQNQPNRMKWVHQHKGVYFPSVWLSRPRWMDYWRQTMHRQRYVRLYAFS